MAIDPSIALGYRPPQVNLEVPSPIQQFGQMMSMRALMEQSQMRKMQMEQEKIQLDNLRQANAGEVEFRRRLGAGETLTPAETVGVLGSQRGVQYLKSAADLEESQHKSQIARMNRLGSIIGSAIDTPTYNRAVMQAHVEGFFDPETARQLITQGYDQARVAQYQRMAMTGEQQAKYALDQAAAKRQEEESAARTASERTQLRLRGLEYAAQTVPDDPATWEVWRAGLQQTNPELLPLIPPQYSKGAYQLVQQYAVKPVAARPGVDIPFSPDVQAQKIATAQAGATAKTAADLASDAQLVDTVKRNPGLFDNLSPELKARLAPKLEAGGFSDFGTKASDTELSKIQDTQKGVDSLRALRAKIRNNPGAVGPISGHLTISPWATERRKLQADIDTARQMIGRALEGGVLRKEDEEKYQRILPTMTDTPEIADYKLEQLDQMMNRDLGTYKASLRAAGRRIGLPGGGGAAALPNVGDTYNGGRVTKVTRIE